MHQFSFRSLCLLSLLAVPAAAATRTWDSGGSDANFSTAANWNPDGVPANGDDLTLGTAAPATVTNDLSGRTFDSVTFDDGVTLAGNAFTLTGGITSSIGIGGRSAATVSANITLGANQTFSSGFQGSLRFTGSVVFGGRTLTVTGSRTMTFEGVTGSGTAGSQLIKNGSGTLRIGDNAFVILTQPLTFSTGTLEADGIVQAVVQQNGGRLTGDGSINGLTATAGDIEPDVSGLTVTGNTTLGGTSRCLFHITGAGIENSLICSGPGVTIQDGATITVDAAGYTPVANESFLFITKGAAGAITGVFVNASDDAEVPVGSTIGQFHYDGGTGNDLVLNIISTTRTWDGGHTLNDNWDEPENWVLNIAPKSGDVLVFPSGIGSTDRGMDNNFPNDTAFRRLVFNGDDFTVRGNRYRLSHGISLGFGAGRANLDTDVTLVRDQTFDFGNTSTDIESRILHLDLADSIETNGKTLTLHGNGTLDGTISGLGGTRAAGGSHIGLSANSDYVGETFVESGAELFVLDKESALGSPAVGTVVEGTLVLVHPLPAATRLHIAEPLAILPDGEVAIRDSALVADIELAGGLDLRGPGNMYLISDGHGRIRIPSAITGTGSLRVETDLVIEGSSANSFTGSMLVGGGKTILQKDTPGVPAVPCAALLIQPSSHIAPPPSLETQQDEQIADNCQVTVGQNCALSIGNVASRTETIGSLVLDSPNVDDQCTVDGPDNSLLIVRGQITKTGPGKALLRTLNIRVEAAPCNFQVDGSVEIFPNTEISRTGSGSIRKAGAGLVFVSDGASLNVPLEIAQGTLTFFGSTPFPITLSGGTLSGGAHSGNEGNEGSNGGIVSIGDNASVVDPGEFPNPPGLFNTKNVSWNARTTYRVDIMTTTAGTGHDRIAALGTVSLGNAILQLVELDGFSVPQGGQVLPLLNDGTDAITGIFAGLPQGAFIPVSAAHGGGGFVISYRGGDGNDVSLTRVPAPPVTPKLTTVVFSRGTGPAGQDVVSLDGSAGPSQTLTLEASTDLQTWTTVQPVTATASGGLSATINQSAGIPKRYFRLR